MKELNFKTMEGIQGGSNLLDCVSQVTGGMGLLWGTAAAIALGSNPFGWALIGLTAIGTAAAMEYSKSLKTMRYTVKNIKSNAMRKTIYIQKGSDFSRRSRVSIVMNGTKMFLPDYKPLRINLKKDEALQISYMWVKSKRLDYNLFQNGKHYVINQLLGKREGFLFFILFSLCIVLFFVTNLVWFVIPILGIGIYILLSVSILSDCYLRLKSINEM